MIFFASKCYCAISYRECFFALGWWDKNKPILWDWDSVWVQGKLWIHFRIGPVFFIRIPGSRVVRKDKTE